jgi:hypothetical protein
MRRTTSLVAVGIIAGLLSCAEQGRDRGQEEALAAAVERTLSAESLHIRAILVDGGEQHVSDVEYVAPDRVRISRLRPSSQTIVVGSDMYISTPEEPNRYLHVETRCDSALEVAVPVLTILRQATEVRRDGPIFIFRSDAVNGMIGQARIQGGHVTSLLLRYDLPDVNRGIIERYSFSRFGADITIAPPPTSTILPSGASQNQGSPAPCPVSDAGERASSPVEPF